MLTMVAYDTAMRVPRIVAVATATVELNKSHASLNEPSGQQTLSAEFLGALHVQAVQLLCLLRLVRDVDHFWSVRLHSVGKLIGGDTRFQIAVSRIVEGVLLVQFCQQIQASSLLLSGNA